MARRRDARSRTAEVLRTREQSIGLFLVGAFAAVFFPWQAFSPDAAGRSVSPLVAWAFAALGLALGAFFMLRLAWCGVRVLETGVRVVNPFVSRFVPWQQIRGFSLRPWNVFPAMAHVDLADGSSMHAWGIQSPNPLVRARNTSAEELVDELQRLLQTYR